MTIKVETKIVADIATVWNAYTTPEDIMAWNAASDDWHTTHATVELTNGGHFSSRMEAKDGSMGFDFAGTYTRIVPMPSSNMISATVMPGWISLKIRKA